MTGQVPEAQTSERKDDTARKTADDVASHKDSGDRKGAADILQNAVMEIRKEDGGGLWGTAKFAYDVAHLNHELHSKNLIPGVDIVGVDEKTGNLKVKDSSGVHVEDSTRLQYDLSPGDATEKQKADALGDAYGTKVRVENKDGVPTYTFTARDAAGKLHDVLTTTDTKDLDKQLENARQQQIKDLEQRFGVKIITDGSDQTHPPNFGELANLQQALVQSEPAQRTANGKPMEIKFHDTGDGIANRSSDGETSTLNIMPDAENDRNLAGILRHEIAHNGDDESHKKELFGIIPTGKIEQEIFYAQLGWHKLDNGDYALRGKDGNLYTQTDKEDSFSDWRPVNEGGVPISGGKTLSNDEMREQAIVKPETPYFPKPWEMQADAFRDYRGGPQLRRELYQNDPNLYKITEAEDQRQIDQYYPPNADGSPSYIRLPSGELAPATDAAKHQVAMFNEHLNDPVASKEEGERRRKKLAEKIGAD